MKKVLMGILLVLSLLVLVACNNEDDTTPPDLVKPVISGADNVSIEVGTAFDRLAGVTAKDKDGKDITSSIKVTGEVNVNVANEYKLDYKVTDSYGATAEKSRTVTVTEKAPLGNLMGGDFSGTSMGEGWGTWFDQSTGYDAEYKVENGALTIDIKAAPATDTQWWAVQVQYNLIKLEKFVSYKLVFKVKADQERYMNHQIQGGNIPGGKAYGESNFTKITTAWTEVEMDFYVKGDAENAQLQFAFGNFGESTGVPAEFKSVPTKVYLDDVKIVEGPELENQAPELTAPNIAVKVGEPASVKQGLAVVDDFTNLTIADITVVQKSPETAFDPQNPVKGVYVFEVSVKDEEGLEAKKERTITVTEPWGRPLSFAVTADGGWEVANAEGFYLRQIDGVYLTSAEADGVTSITIDEMASADFMASFRLANIMFFAGTYEISFEMKADDARKIRVGLENAGLTGDEAFKYIDATTDWVTVTLTYTFVNDQMDKGLDFYLGSLTTERNGIKFTEEEDILTTVHFRNLQVEYTELS